MSKKTAASAGPSTPELTLDPVARFESSMKELEAIVAKMEHGDLPLEESLQLFERGVVLTRECREALASAELRVKNLLAADNNIEAD